MANYPSADPSFPARSAGQTVGSAHMNAVQDEIVAIGAALRGGLSHTLTVTTGGVTVSTGNTVLGQNLSVAGTSTFTGAVTFAAGVTFAATSFANVNVGSGTSTLSTGTIAVPNGGAMVFHDSSNSGKGGQMAFRDLGELANGGVASLAVQGLTALNAFVYLRVSDGAYAQYYLNGSGSTTAELHDVTNAFTPSSGQANSYNVYWSAGNARFDVQNLSGAARVIKVFYMLFH
jgi:hypothetical protein